MARIIKPFYTVVAPEVLNQDAAKLCVKRIADQARICYQSDTSKGHDADCNLIRRCIKQGHETPLEAFDITVLFRTDRGVSHELVRHRQASPQQESTRYCNYSKDKYESEIGVIDMRDWLADDYAVKVWLTAVEAAEDGYMELIRLGYPPEIARCVLPTCLKTDIRLKANVREWRHILSLRAIGTTGKPHPQIKALMMDLLYDLVAWCPACFEDLLKGGDED